MIDQHKVSRRTFLQATAVASALADQAGGTIPWYRRTCRWGQTNINEKDPERYDISWWREYWKRTEVQGIIVNAGGIVAYYPSKFPLHHRAEFLNGRDLFGELAKAAHDDGLVVLARMDSNRTAEDFYRAHPDWFARDSSGQVVRASDKFVTCVNSPYYDEYLPGVLTEIIERSHPEGITDNSWSGLGRDTPCYCANCRRKFRAQTGKDIPPGRNWGDPVYRDWIEWNYARRIEIWDLNNRTTTAAGGPNCLWIGMNSGSITSQAQSFRPMKEICERAGMILLDHQSRSDATGFQQNGDAGKLVHGLLGWDKLAPESMAMYQAGRSTFRAAAKPAPEARMWMLEGFAGGIQPWWHHVGAYQEDRRAYHTAEPAMRWFKANQEYLVNRRPVASVGLVWSQHNTDYYGRDNAADLVDAPYTGFTEALIRARIPYLPVNADHIDRDAQSFDVLVLPNIGALSDAQASSIRRFVERGGGLIATGVSSLYNEWGDARPDFALSSLFGAHAVQPDTGRRARTQTVHTYLRLAPEWRAKVWGPKSGDEPAPTGGRHTVLRGFDETDIIAYGGTPELVRTDPGVIIPLTYVPPFPTYPPESAWMRTPKTEVPGLVLRTVGQSRVAYLPADIDRRFTRDNLPDHGELLANIVRWAAGGQIPLTVKGAGLVDCHLYQQSGRVILHVVNLISAGTWRGPIDELIPIGPLEIQVKLPSDVKGRNILHLVSGERTSGAVRQGSVTFDLKRILDHEVIVIT